MNEVGEFPFVCENCLGPDPYVRMIKSKQGAECKLTSRPFTSFKWRVRGSANGAWRQTQVCIEIAKLKNCCQVCLRDMTYLVPMNVRDSVLKDNPYNVQLPSSFAGQQYFLQRKALEQEQYAQGGSGGGNTTMTNNNLLPPPPPPPPPHSFTQQGIVTMPSLPQGLVPPPPPPRPHQHQQLQTRPNSFSEKRKYNANNIADVSNNNNTEATAKRLKVSHNNDQRIQTSMGHGKILAKRLDDNVYIVELEWKLAGNQKARIYTKTLY